MKRRLVLQAFGWAGLCAPLTPSHGQARPIQVMVGASPGGTTDTLARAIAPAMGQRLQRIVIVENRAGAGGNIAADAVARSAPDGNTLLMSFTSHAINATLYPSLPFDPVKSFTPLSLLATSYAMLVGHPSVPAGDLDQLIGLVRAAPGRFSLALGGVGSSTHLAGDDFKRRAGLEMINVPYRGTSPALADVLGGTVPLMFANIGNALQHVQAGKLKAFGVTSAKRLPLLPALPAIAEVLPGFESMAWFGLFAPAHLAAATAQSISDAARAAVRAASLRAKLESQGAAVIAGSPEAFTPFLQSEIARWGELVRRSGAKVE